MGKMFNTKRINARVVAGLMDEIYREDRHRRKPIDQRRRRLVAGEIEVALIHAQGQMPVVYLNGKRIERVISADEIKGEIVCVPLPIRLNADKTDAVKETLRGVVGIEIVDR